MKKQRILICLIYILGLTGPAFTFYFAGFGFLPIRILIILLSINLILDIFYRKKIDVTIFKNKYLIFLVFWFGYSMFLLIFSPDFEETFTRLMVFLEIILVIVLTNYFLVKEKDYHYLYKYMLLGVL